MKEKRAKSIVAPPRCCEVIGGIVRIKGNKKYFLSLSQ